MATTEPLRSWDAQDADRVVRSGRFSEPPRPTNIDALFRLNEQSNGCDDADLEPYYTRRRLSGAAVFARVCFLGTLLAGAWAFGRWTAGA